MNRPGSRSPSFLTIALALAVPLVLLSQVANAQSASAAKSRVMMANEMLQSERFDDAETNLAQAEKFLDGLPEDEKAPVLKSIAEVRAKIEPAKKAIKARNLKNQIDRDLKQAEESASRNPEAGENAFKTISTRLDSAEVTGLLEAADIATFKSRIAAARKGAAEGVKKEAVAGSVHAASSRMMDAKSALEAGRLLNVEATLQDAEKYLEGLSESERAPIVKGIAEVRAGMGPARKAEEAKEIENRLERDLGAADSNIAAHPEFAEDRISAVKRLLADKETIDTLGATKIAAYQGRLDAVMKKLTESQKKWAVQRAESRLKELEEQLASDPFAGIGDMEAYTVSRKMEGNYRIVKGAIEDFSKDDPEVRAIEARLAVARKKIDDASNSWSTAQVEARLVEGWKFALSNSKGWEDEKPRADQKPSERWVMIGTATVLQNVLYWLNDEQIKKVRASNPDNAVIKATFAEAERTRDAAAVKLNASFEEAMAEAEKMPTPRGGTRFDFAIASSMAVGAEQWFKGTKYQAPNVARAKALEAKWEKELEALRKAAAALRAKFSAEADAAWPAIVKKLGPKEKFAANELNASKGDTILIKRIYNRSGWDFDGGQYEFAARIDGVAVAGSFSPYVEEAIQAMWTKMSAPPLSDREEWDLIAVVEGPATIRRRVITELVAADTREVIGKLDGFKDEQGVQIRIIGLHAGPVAAGAK